jgi:hypothetical protein
MIYSENSILKKIEVDYSVFIYIKSCYGTTRDEMRMRLNADTGSNYAYHNFEVGSALSVARSSAAASLQIGTVADQSAVKKSANFGVYIITFR